MCCNARASCRQHVVLQGTGGRTQPLDVAAHSSMQIPAIAPDASAPWRAIALSLCTPGPTVHEHTVYSYTPALQRRWPRRHLRASPRWHPQGPSELSSQRAAQLACQQLEPALQHHGYCFAPRFTTSPVPPANLSVKRHACQQCTGYRQKQI